jgi:hypothetical protein
VTDRARHHGLDPEDVECKCQPGAADLGGIAAPPELASQRPSDLEPVRVREEWTVNLVRGAHPGLCRKQRVDLTPVVVDRRARQPAATDNLPAHAVVGNPLVDAVQAPRVAHEPRPLLRLLKARLLVAVPIRHLVVVMHEPQVSSVTGADRLKPKARREPRPTGASRRRGYHAAQPPTMVTMLPMNFAVGSRRPTREAFLCPPPMPQHPPTADAFGRSEVDLDSPGAITTHGPSSRG